LVFTNGCFDLLHPGHIQALEQARELGDALVVGINSDASVRQLKGPGRPILRNSSARKFSAALECVDAVVIFNELTPREIIAAILPDILVKGGDWPGDQIIGKGRSRSRRWPRSFCSRCAGILHNCDSGKNASRRIGGAQGFLKPNA